ncbi:MBL fold metallo-hydrolase [Cellulophaga baltica]|uniref:MBL fold metallo-hydrolase n=1 Tax=Cellulophaga TaxID=104264 RepID=UPI001C07DEBA|nr:MULTISPECIES: MBL fold metallo-hydrolase [Cellulophaga]MBU2995205.1 MBL fold metallo-hydrolase [Cellulophaga baltica]MDO6766600.1 MBL fold metallo-hydrolase [Cellulophaga sp. 1_MG-2023]
MKFLKILLTLNFLFLGFLKLQGQNKKVEIKTEKLTDNIYMITGQGGNIGVFIGEEKLFMIDDQFDHLSEQLKECISKLSNKPLSILFNTHMHGDHTGGNANFNSDKVTLVAHDNVRKRVKTNNLEKLREKKIDTNYFTRMLPEITFSNDITFYDGDETIMAFHVHNAHTDGDAIVYFMNNNVLHMGDTYFSKRYPFIDLKSGGSVDGYIDAHKKVLLLINDETKIIPGHGKSSDKKELQEYVLMLEDLKANTLKAIAEGKSLEEVQNSKTISSKYDATHGNGFINPEKLRTTFYTSLK